MNRKKRDIANYLEGKDPEFSIFDLLLNEYLSGALESVNGRELIHSMGKHNKRFTVLTEESL